MGDDQKPTVEEIRWHLFDYQALLRLGGSHAVNVPRALKDIAFLLERPDARAWATSLAKKLGAPLPTRHAQLPSGCWKRC